MCLFFSSIFTHVEIYFWILRALGATGVFFLWLPKLRITFFTRGRKVYDSQVIFARETSPSWKGKLYVSFYIRNFACKCIPKWISQKNCSPEYFRTVFSSMPSVFSRSFQFFFYEIQIRFHSTKKSWTETYIWIQYCTCVFPCLSLSTFFFLHFLRLLS